MSSRPQKRAGSFLDGPKRATIKRDGPDWPRLPDVQVGFEFHCVEEPRELRVRETPGHFKVSKVTGKTKWRLGFGVQLLCLAVASGSCSQGCVSLTVFGASLLSLGQNFRIGYAARWHQSRSKPSVRSPPALRLLAALFPGPPPSPLGWTAPFRRTALRQTIPNFVLFPHPTLNVTILFPSPGVFLWILC